MTNVKKPKPFIAPGSDIALTKEEIEKRKRKIKRLEQLNENYSRITEEECENPYRIQALAMIARDEDVPEELIKKIKEFEKSMILLNQNIEGEPK